MLRKAIFTVMITLAGLGSTACTPLEEGFQSGVSSATAEALSLILLTPIERFVEQVFAKP
jgi:hypothetical protein